MSGAKKLLLEYGLNTRRRKLLVTRKKIEISRQYVLLGSFLILNRIFLIPQEKQLLSMMMGVSAPLSIPSIAVATMAAINNKISVVLKYCHSQSMVPVVGAAGPQGPRPSIIENKVVVRLHDNFVWWATFAVSSTTPNGITAMFVQHQISIILHFQGKLSIGALEFLSLLKSCSI